MIETVKVVDKRPENAEGWKIINKSDMTESDVIYDDPVEDAVKKQKPKPAAKKPEA